MPGAFSGSTRVNPNGKSQFQDARPAFVFTVLSPTRHLYLSVSESSVLSGGAVDWRSNEFKKDKFDKVDLVWFSHCSQERLGFGRRDADRIYVGAETFW